MKNLPVILSSLALVGVIVLFVMQTSDKKKTTTRSGQNTTAASAQGGPGRIAFVNIDTLEANYTYLKNKKDEFTKRQAGMEAELQRSMQQLQNDAMELQKKYQAGTLTQAEGEAGQKRLAQMEQSLATRKNSLAETLLKEQEQFNRDLQSRLDKFLTEYNADKKFDYILSYGEGGTIMYKNPELDITWDVIDGMNETQSAGASDTTKKNK